MDVSQAKKRRHSRIKSVKLKKLAADAMLENRFDRLETIVAPAAEREAIARLRAGFGMSDGVRGSGFLSDDSALPLGIVDAGLSRRPEHAWLTHFMTAAPRLSIR
jgi:hypothetical protein